MKRLIALGFVFSLIAGISSPILVYAGDSDLNLSFRELNQAEELANQVYINNDGIYEVGPGDDLFASFEVNPVINLVNQVYTGDLEATVGSSTVSETGVDPSTI